MTLAGTITQSLGLSTDEYEDAFMPEQTASQRETIPSVTRCLSDSSTDSFMTERVGECNSDTPTPNELCLFTCAPEV